MIKFSRTMVENEQNDQCVEIRICIRDYVKTLVGFRCERREFRETRKRKFSALTLNSDFGFTKRFKLKHAADRETQGHCRGSLDLKII
jgi:hypothetical protein